MTQFLTLLKYELMNVLRGKWLFLYALMFSGIAYSIGHLGGDTMKAALSLMNLVILVTPIVSILYASIYWYNADGFTTLLLTQPLRRWGIFVSRWIAIALTLSLCFVAGTALPFFIQQTLTGPLVTLLLLGTALTFAFTSIGLLISVLFNDRMKGIGAAFLLWFYFSIVHDGLVFSQWSFFANTPSKTHLWSLLPPTLSTWFASCSL
ncbi:MAG: ABC transporter permease subunit [Bdellovibrionales bacterium]|nr:ABC transporter permease subunit [Bdellovibrionales bacterium]